MCLDERRATPKENKKKTHPRQSSRPAGAARPKQQTHLELSNPFGDSVVSKRLWVYNPSLTIQPFRHTVRVLKMSTST